MNEYQFEKNKSHFYFLKITQRKKKVFQVILYNWSKEPLLCTDC